MKKLLIIYFSLLITQGSFAQKSIDVIYLQNESIYKGKIIEQTDEKVKIETQCGNILVFKTDEILKIDKEKYISKNFIKSKGYVNFTSFGILVGDRENEVPTPLSVISEHNYILNKYSAIGILFGFEKLNETVVPLALNGKGLLPLNHGTMLYLGVSGGYSFSLEKPTLYYYELKDANGGVLFNAELGIIMASNSNASVFLALGYRYNQLNYVREDWAYGDVDRKMIYNRLSIKLGISLH